MSIDTAENPCPNCGTRSFRWGILEASGGVRFKEDNRLTLFSGEALRARLCNTCGNIQVFLRAEVEDAVIQSDVRAKQKRKRER